MSPPPPAELPALAPDRREHQAWLHALADLRQRWVRHLDGWVGRRRWGAFAPEGTAGGTFAGAPPARGLTNTTYAAPWYGHEMAASMRALVRRGLVEAAESDAFLADQAPLAAVGRHGPAITGYAYVGRRR